MWADLNDVLQDLAFKTSRRGLSRGAHASGTSWRDEGICCAHAGQLAGLHSGAVTAFWGPLANRISQFIEERIVSRRNVCAFASHVVVVVLLLVLAGCSGSGAGQALLDQSSNADSLGSPDTTPGIVNLDDADLLIDDLRVDPEIRAELSAELALQLDISVDDADCLASEIDVEDLLAMSASNADEGALERILVAFDSCDVPRSVFDQ